MDDAAALPQPKNRYALTKWLGEQLVEYEVRTNSARGDLPSVMIYDEFEDLGDHRSAMIRFAANLARGKSIEVHRGSARGWLHVSDAVRAIEAAGRMDRYSIINVGHPDIHPMAELAEMMRHELNTDPSLIKVTAQPGQMTLGSVRPSTGCVTCWASIPWSRCRKAFGGSRLPEAPGRAGRLRQRACAEGHDPDRGVGPAHHPDRAGVPGARGSDRELSRPVLESWAGSRRVTALAWLVLILGLGVAVGRVGLVTVPAGPAAATWVMTDFYSSAYYPTRAVMEGVNPHDRERFMAQYPVAQRIPRTSR